MGDYIGGVDTREDVFHIAWGRDNKIISYMGEEVWRVYDDRLYSVSNEISLIEKWDA